jgi:hypothetical protein
MRSVESEGVFTLVERMNDGELIIVDEPDDVFSEAFGHYATQARAGWRRIRMDEFSREVTIEHEAGIAKVNPECAMLLRPLRGVGATSDEESRFCWNEQFSALWSAAALNAKSVVNRPNEWGWAGRATFSSALSEHRFQGTVLAPEAFWHDLPPSDVSQMFHQDLTTWTTVEKPQEVAYVRSRLLPKCQGWEQVIVVGCSAFRVTTADLGSWSAEDESKAVAASLHLEFATVSWAISAHVRRGILARVNPFPTLAECAPVWHDVCATLLRKLSS